MTTVTFVLDHPDIEALIVTERDDGTFQYWEENSWSYLDQWIRFYAPLNEPITIKVEDAEAISARLAGIP